MTDGNFGLSEQEIKSWRDAFNLFDRDGNGHITGQELRSAIKRVGLQANDQWVRDLIREADKDGNDTIEFPEFLRAVGVKMRQPNAPETVTRVTQKTMVQQEVSRTSRSLYTDVAKKHGFSDSDVKRYRDAFNMFDTNRDGRITKDELRASIRSCGMRPTDEWIDDLIWEADRDDSGTIEFPEFLRALGVRLKDYREMSPARSRVVKSPIQQLESPRPTTASHGGGRPENVEKLGNWLGQLQNDYQNACDLKGLPMEDLVHRFTNIQTLREDKSRGDDLLYKAKRDLVGLREPQRTDVTREVNQLEADWLDTSKKIDSSYSQLGDLLNSSKKLQSKQFADVENRLRELERAANTPQTCNSLPDKEAYVMQLRNMVGETAALEGQMRDAKALRDQLAQRGIVTPQIMGSNSRRLDSVQDTLKGKSELWNKASNDHSEYVGMWDRFKQWIDRKTLLARELTRDHVNGYDQKIARKNQLEELRSTGDSLLAQLGDQLRKVLRHTGPAGSRQLNEDYAALDRHWRELLSILNAMSNQIDIYPPEPQLEPQRPKSQTSFRSPVETSFDNRPASSVGPSRPVKYRIPGLQQKDVKGLEDAFNLFDKNSTGTITAAELREAIRKVGMRPSERWIKDLMREADRDGSGEIDLFEFLKAMTGKDPILVSEDEDYQDYQVPRTQRIVQSPPTYNIPGFTEAEIQEFRKAFDLFDLNNNGLISDDELKKAARACGLHPNDQWVREVMANVDLDGSGQIDWPEFLKAVTGLATLGPPQPATETYIGPPPLTSGAQDRTDLPDWRKRRSIEQLESYLDGGYDGDVSRKPSERSEYDPTRRSMENMLPLNAQRENLNDWDDPQVKRRSMARMDDLDGPGWGVTDRPGGNNSFQTWEDRNGPGSHVSRDSGRGTDENGRSTTHFGAPPAEREMKGIFARFKPMKKKKGEENEPRSVTVVPDDVDSNLSTDHDMIYIPNRSKHDIPLDDYSTDADDVSGRAIGRSSSERYMDKDEVSIPGSVVSGLIDKRLARSCENCVMVEDFHSGTCPPQHYFRGGNTLYEDRFVKLTEGQLLLKTYYFPFFTPRKINLNDVKLVFIRQQGEEKPFNATSWGCTYPGTVWWALNWRREFQDQNTNVVLDLGAHRTRKGFSVREIGPFLTLLKQQIKPDTPIFEKLPGEVKI